MVSDWAGEVNGRMWSDQQGPLLPTPLTFPTRPRGCLASLVQVRRSPGKVMWSNSCLGVSRAQVITGAMEMRGSGRGQMQEQSPRNTCI